MKLRTILLCLVIGVCLTGLALAQTIPNGNTSITQGLVWTAAQWNTAWQSKVDVTSGSSTSQTLTTPTITGGTISGTLSISNVAISSTLPVIASGFGTSPSITANGTLAGVITIGSAPGSTGTLTMPAATNGWACRASDVTTQSTSVSQTLETAYTATSVTFTQFSDVMVATAWVAADKVVFTCTAF